MPIRIPTTPDSPKGSAYFRRINTLPGVVLGNNLVTNKEGYCDVMVRNYREDPVEIEITIRGIVLDRYYE